MRRQIKQKNRCASHQKRSIVRPMLSVMAIQIALTAEELGKIVSAGIPSIGTRKAIYQLTVYFAKETVAFCMFLLAQPACGTPRQSHSFVPLSSVFWTQPACGTPRKLAKRRAWPVFLVTSVILSENRQFFRFGCCSSAKNTV